MFTSEDGYVNGSIDNSKLDEVEAKTPEAKARLQQLKAERDAANAQADADAERLAKLHEAQSIQGQVRETVTTQARAVEVTPEGAKLSDPNATDQKADASTKQDDAEVARLQTEAEQAGVTVDKRWGADRLQQEIDSAKAAAASQRKGK